VSHQETHELEILAIEPGEFQVLLDLGNVKFGMVTDIGRQMVQQAVHQFLFVETLFVESLCPL
jgi:hypothetical protein